MKLRITFPIIKTYSSKYYPLMAIDSSNVTHYWNFDGSYDGYSSDPCVDGESGINLN